MEIRSLKAFVKIAELSSFTKAAQELGYAQSTLTFHVQAIESECGRPVFEKLGKTIQLTAFGRQLLEQANAVLAAYGRLEQLGCEDAQPRGSLRIGAPESLMMYRLFPIIRAYKLAYPQVEVSVVNDPCEYLRDHLVSGQLDLSFLLQPEFRHKSLETVLLREETMCLVAPAGHSDERFLPGPTQMVLYTEKDCTYRQEYDRYLVSCQFRPANILETASVEAIKEYLLNGLGVSYLPYYAVRKEAEQGLLSVKFLPAQLHFFTQIAYHKNKWVSPAMQAFLDMSREQSLGWK